jgi:hypothetical protein
MKRRKRNRINEQFLARVVSMLESPAYRVLSLSARRVLDRLEIELAHHGGNDNGDLAHLLPTTAASLHTRDPQPLN